MKPYTDVHANKTMGMHCSDAMALVNKYRDTDSMFFLMLQVRARYDNESIEDMDFVTVRMFFAQAVYVSWYYARHKPRNKANDH